MGTSSRHRKQQKNKKSAIKHQTPERKPKEPEELSVPFLWVNVGLTNLPDDAKENGVRNWLGLCSASIRDIFVHHPTHTCFFSVPDYIAWGLVEQNNDRHWAGHIINVEVFTGRRMNYWFTKAGVPTEKIKEAFDTEGLSEFYYGQLAQELQRRLHATKLAVAEADPLEGRETSSE